MNCIKLLISIAIGVSVLTACDKDPADEVVGTAGTNNGSANGGNTGTGSGSSQGNSGTTPVKYQISTWHWGSDSNLYGINYVVNDSVKANSVLSDYLDNSIVRVYGAYSRIPDHPTQKYKLARWNKLLKEKGIATFYLAGDASWIYTSNRTAMLDYLKKYYISFNQTFSTAERFDGLHVDIEPHQLSEWNLATLERKRELLYLLKDTYRDIRNLQIENGFAGDELAADIPVWFDSIDAIGWKSTADRDSWFADAGNYLTGFSLMAYEVSSTDQILSRTVWERTNFKGKVEVGLDAGEIGSVWSTKQIFIDALKKLYTSTKKSVALHNYAVFLGK